MLNSNIHIVRADGHKECLHNSRSPICPLAAPHKAPPGLAHSPSYILLLDSGKLFNYFDQGKYLF